MHIGNGIQPADIVAGHGFQLSQFCRRFLSSAYPDQTLNKKQTRLMMVGRSPYGLLDTIKRPVGSVSLQLHLTQQQPGIDEIRLLAYQLLTQIEGGGILLLIQQLQDLVVCRELMGCHMHINNIGQVFSDIKKPSTRLGQIHNKPFELIRICNPQTGRGCAAAPYRCGHRYCRQSFCRRWYPCDCS